jgi:hypothetical protein
VLLAFLVGARIAGLVLDVDDDGSGLDTIALQAIAIAVVTFAVTFTVFTMLTVLTLAISPVALFAGAPGACRGGAVDADVFVHGGWAQVSVAEAGAEASAGDGAPPMMLFAGILHHGDVGLRVIGLRFGVRVAALSAHDEKVISRYINLGKGKKMNSLRR